MSLTVKVTLQHARGMASTRKMTLARAATTPFTSLVQTVQERFSLPQDADIALIYYDHADGEPVTISSDAELQEYIASLGPHETVLRFDIVFLAREPTEAPTQFHSPASSAHHTSSSYAPSASEHADELEREQAEHITRSPLSKGCLPEPAESDDESDGFEMLSEYGSSDGTDVPELEGDKGKGRAVEDVHHALEKLDLASTPPVAAAETEVAFATFVTDDDPVDEPLAASSGAASPTVAAAADTLADNILAASTPAPAAPALNDANSYIPTPTSADDPDDAPLPTSSPTPTATPATPFPAPFPAAISSFFASFPFLPPNLSTTLQSSLQNLVADPSPERFQRLFPTASTTIDELPHVALGLVGEAYSVLNEMRDGLRKEAEGLRKEFEELKKGVEDEAEKVRNAVEEAVNGAAAAPAPAPAPASAPAPIEAQAHDARVEREHAEDVIQREVDDGAEAAAKMQGDWDAEKAQDGRVRDAERAHAKKVKKEVEKALQADKEHRRIVKEQRKAEKEQRRADRKERHFQRSFAPRAGPTAPISPFDDAYKVDSDGDASLHIAATGPTRTSRIHVGQTTFSAEREAHRAARMSPSAPAAAVLPQQDAAAPVLDSAPVETDDFFRRRLGARASMPGSFETAPVQPTAPVAPSIAPYPTLAAPSRLPAPHRSYTHFPGMPSTQQPFAPLSRSISHPTSTRGKASSHTFRMPGSFLTSPNPAPIPSTSATPHEPAPGAGEEVLPAQLQDAIAGLGFDMRDLGVRVACERSWEEGRGKKLEEMVAAVLEKVLM